MEGWSADSCPALLCREDVDGMLLGIEIRDNCDIGLVLLTMENLIRFDQVSRLNFQPELKMSVGEKNMNAIFL
jgi:hypothetical protein